MSSYGESLSEIVRKRFVRCCDWCGNRLRDPEDFCVHIEQAESDANSMSKRIIIRNVLNILAFTHRRTPKDVDGRRWDVPCVVLAHYRRAKMSKPAHKWVHVRFNDGSVDVRHVNNVFTNLASKTPVFRAMKDVTTGKWWINSNGVLERVATRYEVDRTAFDAPPSSGWTLVDGDSYVGEQKQKRILGAPRGESELERLERERKAAALQKRREKRRDHAAEMLLLHRRNLKREEMLVERWTREYARAMKVMKP